MGSDATLPIEPSATYRDLLRETSGVSYELTRLDEQHYRIDYVNSSKLKGLISPEGNVALDGSQSSFNVRFSATFDMSNPEKPQIELGDVVYDIATAPGFSFDVH